MARTNPTLSLLPHFLGLLVILLALQPTVIQTGSGIGHSGIVDWKSDYVGPIQPGAPLREGGTLGWIFLSMEQTNLDGEPVLYASSHGHGSIPEEGETVRLAGGQKIKIGEVVLKEDNPENGRDWALIEIFEESRPHVDYSLRYWTGPTGMPDPDQIEQDDIVCHYGWGIGHSYREETRPRCGALDSARYVSPGIGRIHTKPITISGGDSGSPLIHYETGQALGIAITIGFVRPGANWVSVCTLVEQFAERGFAVELATADYDPPPAKPVPPNPESPIFGLDTACLGG